MKKNFKKDLLNFSKTFSFEDNLILPTIYGEGDKFLAQIENSLNVKIITRGNIIKVEGPEENVNLAKKILSPRPPPPKKSIFARSQKIFFSSPRERVFFVKSRYGDYKLA